MYAPSRTSGSTSRLSPEPRQDQLRRGQVLALPGPVSLRPLVLLTPSIAPAVKLPRRLASTGRAIAGVYALKPLALARLLAEPVLLGRGLQPRTSGPDALGA